MVVCLCANVTDRELDAVIAGGARSVKAVARRCGAGAGCGACHLAIRDQIRAHVRTSAETVVESAPDLGALAPSLATA
jgi:bacterioferritin-associated ferredoxin